MKKLRYFSIVLMAISLTFIYKGVSLLREIPNVDGDGIGLYFFGLEINETLPKEEISLYAWGFLGAALALIVLASLAYGLYFYRKKKNI